MHHSKILCDVSNVAYDTNTKVGTVRAPVHNPPDMDGTIEVFQAISPEVQRIDCYEGDQLSTIYIRKGNDWESKLL